MVGKNKDSFRILIEFLTNRQNHFFQIFSINFFYYSLNYQKCFYEYFSYRSNSLSTENEDETKNHDLSVC